MAKILARQLITASKIIQKNTKLVFKQPIATCYRVVARIEDYPTFVPWVHEAKILSKEKDKSEYLITFGFSPLIETYKAQVFFEPDSKILLYSSNNEVFDILESAWELSPKCPNICEASYSVKFKFSSPVYQRFSSVVIHKIFSETSKIFVNHIDQLPQVKFSS